MIATRKTVYLAFLLALVNSCSREKTEKEFAGKYKSYYATKIVLGNSFTGLFFGGKASKPTTRSYNDLGEISLELFLDKDGIRGEESIVIKKSQNMSFNPAESTNKMSFDLSNFRMAGDTLIFSISNQLLSLQGKKYSGSIIKNESGIFLGFDRTNAGIDSVRGPFDAKEQDGILYLKCFEKERVLELTKTFFQEQERDLTTKLSSEHDDNKRKILENSIEAVRKQMSSFTY